jgi:hypothetical protein
VRKLVSLKFYAVLWSLVFKYCPFLLRMQHTTVTRNITLPSLNFSVDLWFTNSSSCSATDNCSGNYTFKCDACRSITLTLYIIACNVYPSYGTSRDSSCQHVIPKEYTSDFSEGNLPCRMCGSVYITVF